jgi:hypothetical protein
MSNSGFLTFCLFQHVSSWLTHHQENYKYALVYTVILQCYNIKFIIMLCNICYLAWCYVKHLKVLRCKSVKYLFVGFACAFFSMYPLHYVCTFMFFLMGEFSMYALYLTVPLLYAASRCYNLSQYTVVLLHTLCLALVASMVLIYLLFWSDNSISCVLQWLHC